MPIKDCQKLWELPPIGQATDQDHALFANVRDRIDTEGKQERDKWTPIRNACLNIFAYGDYDQIITGVVPPDKDKMIVNHAQGDMIGIKDVMFREPIQVEVSIEDDGSNVLAYYWNGPQHVNTPLMQDGIDPMTGQAMQQPVLNPMGQPMTQQVPVSMMYGIPPSIPDPVTGEPIAQPIDEQHAQELINSGLPLNWIVAATNKIVSDMEQMVFDGGWRDCYADEWWDQFTQTTIKGGYNTGIYQFDEDGHHFLNLPTTNVFPDPTKQFVWNWEQNDVHWVLRLPIAQRKFPKYAQLLAEQSQLGNPRQVNALTEQGYQYDRDFQTRTVTLSVTHLANQPIPMTPEEAINGGHISVQQPFDLQQGTSGDLSNNFPSQSEGTGLATEQQSLPLNAETESETQGNAQTVGNENQLPSADAGQPGSVSVTPDSAATQPYPSPAPTSGPSPQDIAPAQHSPPTPPVFISHATGEPIDQSSNQWPMRYTLRQFIMLGPILIEDDENAWPTIQIIHATCIPQEDTPYGFSPLWKMRFSQRSDSQMAEAISRNCKFIGNPASYAAEAVKQRIEKNLGTAFIEPDMMIGMLSDEFDNTGKPKVGFIEVPPMNEHHIEGRAQMQADRKELGGFTDALKGVAVTTNAPAELQRETMSAASGIVSSISKHLQGTIKHTAGLMLHSQLYYMGFDKIFKRCKKYNRDVLAALHYTHAVGASWKIDALLSSGAGTQRMQRRQELLELNQSKGAGNMPLCDDESVQEAYNLDPETVKQRNLQAAQSGMQMAPADGSGQDPPHDDQPQNGNNQQPQNGNGANRF